MHDNVPLTRACHIFETSTVLNNPEPPLINSGCTHKHHFLIFSALVIALVWLNNWLSVVYDSSFVCHSKLAIDCIYTYMHEGCYISLNGHIFKIFWPNNQVIHFL